MSAAASVSSVSGGEDDRTPLLDTPTTPHPDGPAAMERLKAEQAQEDREKKGLQATLQTLGRSISRRPGDLRHPGPGSLRPATQGPHHHGPGC